MTFKVTPIGGVDQIGSNMILIEGPTGHSIIDCGILFPYEDFFGIRYLIPNFKDIPRPDHVFITHGHEDHIGALAHLCEQFPDLHIIAPPFAATLIMNKFEFYPRKLKYKLEVQNGESYLSSGLKFDYVQVNHSIPDTFGIHITNEDTGTGAFYVSDFKVDPLAKQEPYFDFEKLKHLRNGLTRSVLMSDSTNITSSLEKTTSETELIPAFNEIMAQDFKRIFVTTFSSNIHRMVNIIEAAQKSGRKVVLYGRSVKNYFQVGVENDLIPAGVKTYDVDEVDTKKDQLAIIVSGCQGDFRSTFRRIAFSQDSYFKLNEKDCFVLSSKSIPGNEKKISLCLNQISLTHCHIITASEKLIHASGHAGKEDLSILFKNYSPDFFIPIHGESFFLERHSKWIAQENENIQTTVIHNHDQFDVEKFKVYPCESTEDLGPIIIHANSFEFNRDQIRERRKIAEGGLINIALVADGKKIKYDIFHTGISFPEQYPEDQMLENIRRILHKNHKANKDHSEQMRIEVRRLISQTIGDKPIVRVSYIK